MGGFGNYGAVSEGDSIFKTMRKLRVAMNFKTKQMLRSLEFLPNAKSYAIEKGVSANL